RAARRVRGRARPRVVRDRPRTDGDARPPQRRVRARDERHLPPAARADPRRAAGDPRAARVAGNMDEGRGRGSQPPRRATVNVVVVGGGVAGITAALDCAAAGASVTLVEVRPRLGGAAYSVEREHGLWVDNGQHVFLRCCTAYRELLAALGSEQYVEVQPRL